MAHLHTRSASSLQLKRLIAVLLAIPPKAFARRNVRNGDFWPRDSREKNYTASKIALNFARPYRTITQFKILRWYVRAGAPPFVSRQKVERKYSERQKNVVRKESMEQLKRFIEQGLQVK